MRVRLDTIRDPSCKKCGLHRTATNVCIMGRGNRSPIMSIGEAPGKAEATHGKPFCGRSGQWMQSILDEMELTNHVFITNTCRCRPPGNRTPRSDEIIACRSFLQGEIRVIKPKILVALGRTAQQGLRITGDRGIIIKSNQWKRDVMHTFHPAYCIRTGKDSRASREFKSHLEKLGDYV